jgi:signal peptidase I
MGKSKIEKETKKPAAEEAKPADGGWRETVESIAMAVILALLFRGFVAEAFVIPTGSMAPTLQGRHKDVECPKCLIRYRTSGSEEQRDDRPTGLHVYTTTCPICRYTQTLDPINDPNEGSFSGDRIIVGKFPYDFAEPQRWDVIVFKFPGNAVQNYIKRLVGLPGETVRIVGGNIYVQRQADAGLRIARKPPDKLEALLQLVDDTDHIPQELIDIGWPARWQAWPAGSSAWETQNGGRAFVCNGNQQEDAWLRYRHLVPTHADWESIELRKELPSDAASRPGQLITDYYAYNTPRYMPSEVAQGWSVLPGGLRRRWSFADAYLAPTQIEQRPGPGDPPPPEMLGQHWVDDLAVECVADVRAGKGELLLMLVRGGTKHVCRINLVDGKATLSIIEPDGGAKPFETGDGKTALERTAQTSVRSAGSYRLRLANCDHEMLLWVNGSVVEFDGPTTYEPDDERDLLAPAYSPAEPGDLGPAGVGSRGAELKVSSLRIFRDKYYIATTGTGYGNDYDNSPDPARIQEIFRNPAQWESSGLFAPGNRRHEQFALKEDQFLPLGDNSPQSYDARYWFSSYDEHHYVERDLLIGKALLIYWPHTWNRPIPYMPNFRRMGLIR